MISRILCLVILVIISSFPIVSSLQLPPRVMAQVPPSEGAKVLVDDVIQALKVNDTEKAQVHLSILNQQLPTFVNSTSLQSVKVLLDDVSSALKNKNINSALIHLNLVKQQLGFASNVSNSTESIGQPQIVKVKSNHPPVAYGDNLTVTSGSQIHFKLRANDSDGDPIRFSIDETQPYLPITSFGTLEDLNPNTGDVTYKTNGGCDTCTESFTFHATDSHNATSNTGYYLIKIKPQPSTSNAETTTPPESAAPPESSVLPSPSEEPSQNIAPPVNNENPSNTGTDYSSICAKLQPVLIQQCSTLVSTDGSLTSEGTHALNCIKNGILLGGGAAVVGVPLPIILKGLSILAAPTGCGDVVNMKGFEQLGDIGSLSSITSLLP
ncbi:MAG TPA: Ig-like domain-containing protein [Nitrososphaeraceae archaeon]|nr:Ig-like domain-containing protein [Nitrososphaeraceae archaeon]